MSDNLPEIQDASIWIARLEAKISIGSLEDGASFKLITDRDEKIAVDLLPTDTKSQYRIVAAIPTEVSDGLVRQITLQASDGTALSKPSLLMFPGPSQNCSIDGLSIDLKGCNVYGWALEWPHPERPVEMSFRIDGELVAKMHAKEFRSDIANLGFSKGYHGFNVILNGTLIQKGHRLSILANGTEVDGSPFLLSDHRTQASDEGSDTIAPNQNALLMSDMVDLLSRARVLGADDPKMQSMCDTILTKMEQTYPHLETTIENNQLPNEFTIDGVSVYVHETLSNTGSKSSLNLDQITKWSKADILVFAHALDRQDSTQILRDLARCLAESPSLDLVGLCHGPEAAFLPTHRTGPINAFAISRKLTSNLARGPLKSIEFAGLNELVAALNDHRTNLQIGVMVRPDVVPLNTKETGGQLCGLDPVSWTGTVAAILPVDHLRLSPALMVATVQHYAAILAVSGHRPVAVLPADLKDVGEITTKLIGRGVECFTFHDRQKLSDVFLRQPDILLTLHRNRVLETSFDFDIEFIMKNLADNPSLPLLGTISKRERAAFHKAGFMPHVALSAAKSVILTLDENQQTSLEFSETSAHLEINDGDTFPVRPEVASLMTSMLVDMGVAVKTEDGLLRDTLCSQLGFDASMVSADADPCKSVKAQRDAIRKSHKLSKLAAEFG